MTVPPDLLALAFDVGSFGVLTGIFWRMGRFSAGHEDHERRLQVLEK